MTSTATATAEEARVEMRHLYLHRSRGLHHVTDPLHPSSALRMDRMLKERYCLHFLLGYSCKQDMRTQIKWEEDNASIMESKTSDLRLVCSVQRALNRCRFRLITGSTQQIDT
jgi:hypothetical protein